VDLSLAGSGSCVADLRIRSAARDLSQITVTAQSLDRLQSEAAAGKFLQADLAGERSNPCKLQGLD
jgi:hypothetical protein